MRHSGYVCVPLRDGYRSKNKRSRWRTCKAYDSDALGGCRTNVESSLEPRSFSKSGEFIDLYAARAYSRRGPIFIFRQPRCRHQNMLHVIKVLGIHALAKRVTPAFDQRGFALRATFDSGSTAHPVLWIEGMQVAILATVRVFTLTFTTHRKSRGNEHSPLFIRCVVRQPNMRTYGCG